MTINYKIGKANIKALTIRSAAVNNIVNISSAASEIFVYEDLFSPNITGNINVLDGTSILTTLPIVGGEEISMNISDYDSTSRSLNRNLIVFKISTRTKIKNDLEAYTLNLTTKESLLDATTSVDRSYKKPVHEIIQDIVTEFLTPISGKKLISNEKTKGIQHIVATRLNVNAFIKQLCREAESIDNPSSIYLFYETMEGYHFESLDGLYAKDPSHRFTYDEIKSSESTPGESNKLQNNISFLELNNSFNLIHGQVGGQFNTSVNSFDPLTKTFKNTSHDSTKEKFSKNNRKTISNKTFKSYFNTPTVNKYVVTNSHRSATDYIINEDNETQNTFRRRQDFITRESSTLMQFGSTRIHFSIPSNPNIIVGQTMNLIIPRASDTISDKRVNDPLITGKYIATAVAHKIDVTDGTYATVVEAMRKNYPEKVT